MEFRHGWIQALRLWWGLASLLGVSRSGNIRHSDTEAQTRGGAGAPPGSPAFPGILLVQLGFRGGGGRWNPGHVLLDHEAPGAPHPHV